MTTPIHPADCAATVTREDGLYRIALPDDSERAFVRAQDAADWLELHAPGAKVEWRVQ